jgi:hypothetical protein
MNLLYKGRYQERFEVISRLIKGTKVTELCFGDTIIARYCRKNNISWKGYDTNDAFVNEAKAQNYNAEMSDINDIESFEKADTCIMSGSLYHFHNSLEEIIKKMLDCAPHVIISEPILNLSASRGIIGKLAKGAANVNGGEHGFRFTEESFLREVIKASKKLNFTFKVSEYHSKDIIIEISK